MFDELLGRAKLKARIEDVEEQRTRLERQLDAEEERRREAVRDRQEADERVNRLEDRVAELEDRVERLQGDEDVLEFRGVETVRGDRLRTVLDRLESVDTTEEGLLTTMIDDEVTAEVREAFGDRAALLGRAAPCLALTDDAGVVSTALSPAIEPDPFVRWDDSFGIEREWFLPVGDFAVALVRSDLFAIGEYRGTERLSFTGFESDVTGTHSKGGFSQGRFERRRDAQIDEHLERCEEAIEARRADRLIVVGERTILGELADDAVGTAAVDATGDPEDALDNAFRQFWTGRVYRI